MDTFGQFFQNLRSRIEQTGRTDSQCRDMDHYKDKRRTERVIPWGREDRGWKRVADQKLSYDNLMEFSAEMAQAGMQDLLRDAKSEYFLPEHFGWHLDAAHEFHHAMLEEARECGLDTNHSSGWMEAREKRKQQKSA
jgi:hypothetical protein